ncbi:hypothetical protein [Streptomyces sp. NBC_01264]|uniref:hypothetical protein n=1 Tax=Streptomyces sp. NBC_01264 TaxID=2903804 RepID=UPI0022529A34|nr:hypothetical protein [Streptomyces sp. NBC_01264]MCX4779914.1 hypothetical protein [Streptomyces sp. NBC_01264]
MRTKPTMYKRMLRSALAVVFSVVAIFGAVAAVNGDTGSAVAGASAPAEKKVGNDFGWDSVQKDAGNDFGWNTTPAQVS